MTLVELQDMLDNYGRTLDERTDTSTCDYCGEWISAGYAAHIGETTELFIVHEGCLANIDTGGAEVVLP
jgi:hypothetical protein